MRIRLCLLALLALVGLPTLAVAQLTVRADRNLQFGIVIKGVQKYVPPNDPVNSGEFEFTATLGNIVRFQFTLPTNLNGPAGARMPISFGTTDGIAQGTGPTSVPVTFNPNGTPSFTLVSSNRILVFIGGRVTPAANQTSGAYTAPITFTVTIIG
ncbi:MAG TPA: hypothetical protein VLT17_00475 [Gemmatimonadales bacterium]|nr:hypothetical protein [Gemmatimonadales bacterium]